MQNRLLLCLSVFVAVGCQSYSPYGYGYGYGGAYPIPPGQTYMPQGTVIAPGAQPTLAPGATLQPPPRAYAPTPGGTLSDAPAYQPPTTQPPAAGAQQPNRYLPQETPSSAPKRVPDPLDDEDEMPKKPVGAKDSSGAHLGSITDDAEDNVTAFGEEAFTKPVPVRSASSTTTHGAGTHQAARPNPYGFDSKKYSWLRGIVEQDDSDGTWRIRYNADPQRGDMYGGTLTLVNDQKLDTLIANDVVLLEGSVDTMHRDRFAKPMYRVQKALRLVPKGVTQ